MKLLLRKFTKTLSISSRKKNRIKAEGNWDKGEFLSGLPWKYDEYCISRKFSEKRQDFKENSMGLKSPVFKKEKKFK